MVKSYELNVDTKDFEAFVRSQKYLITKDQDYQVGDFILLRETARLQAEDHKESMDDQTNKYRMTSIDEIIKNDGLKEGYVLLILQSK